MSNNRKMSTSTRIEVIRTEQKNMLIILKEIKENTKDLPVLRTDVSWLKYWHNKIILGTGGAVLLAGTLGLLKLLGK